MINDASTDILELLHSIVIHQNDYKHYLSLTESNILKTLHATRHQPTNFSWKQFVINALTYVMIFMFGYFIGKLPDIIAWFCTIFS